MTAREADAKDARSFTFAVLLVASRAVDSKGKPRRDTRGFQTER